MCTVFWYCFPLLKYRQLVLPIVFIFIFKCFVLHYTEEMGLGTGTRELLLTRK